ncbi:TetR-like C-terminal domain-containing protein [Glaciibacter psychrotolerans]|uniref:AcrR family transcriptional regulator n=1 Tax=Glaciibacter psychrotolerans TaxID=670054 RepID=A0A7Z0EBA5_9MICO|nr:TetR-like C-terminal domain-containing protein [Leifsonia psychrotolerans]NYJ18301.1 AcrR family transcriptional regulator [Leifsonia psychrotolerans]
MTKNTLDQATAPRRGRPLDAALAERVFAAVLTQLSAVGYPRLEIETVAADSGCSKTTIYRRWGTKAHLVAVAIASEFPGTVEIDTGTIVDDFIEHIGTGPSLLSFGSLAPVAWTAMLEPEVSAFLRDEVLASRDEAAERFIGRAIARGELPADVDGPAILHAVLGFGLYTRYLVNSAVNASTLRQIVTALVTSPPTLTR